MSEKSQRDASKTAGDCVVHFERRRQISREANKSRNRDTDRERQAPKKKENDEWRYKMNLNIETNLYINNSCYISHSFSYDIKIIREFRNFSKKLNE